MLFLRGNFKNVTIDLAMHSHSAPISVCGAFQLRENNLTYMYIVREELKTHDNCADFIYLSTKYFSYFHNKSWFL